MRSCQVSEGYLPIPNSQFPIPNSHTLFGAILRILKTAPLSVTGNMSHQPANTMSLKYIFQIQEEFMVKPV